MGTNKQEVMLESLTRSEAVLSHLIEIETNSKKKKELERRLSNVQSVLKDNLKGVNLT